MTKHWDEKRYYSTRRHVLPCRQRQQWPCLYPTMWGQHLLSCRQTKYLMKPMNNYHDTRERLRIKSKIWWKNQKNKAALSWIVKDDKLNILIWHEVFNILQFVNVKVLSFPTISYFALPNIDIGFRRRHVSIDQ